MQRLHPMEAPGYTSFNAIADNFYKYPEKPANQAYFFYLTTNDNAHLAARGNHFRTNIMES